MKKVIYLFWFFFICNNSYSQLADYKLLPDGTFTTTSGTEYIVINYNDKTASELYGMVRNNIFKLFPNSSSVMTENPYNTIKVRCLLDVGYIKILIQRKLGGYYNVQFQFKDGKIRIDKPYIESELISLDGTLDPPGVPSYKSFINKLYKNGIPKDVKQIEGIESIVNYLVKYSVGLTNVSNDDDW